MTQLHAVCEALTYSLQALDRNSHEHLPHCCNRHLMQAPTQDNELALAKYRHQQEFPLLLLQVALAAELPVELRQMAAIVLKNHVEKHWAAGEEDAGMSQAHDDSEQALAVSPEVKGTLRTLLLERGLGDREPKVRSTLAYVVAKIAHCDDQWPGLFDALMQRLQSGDLAQVHGSMQVLAEFIRDDVTDQQFPQMAPVLLPQLLRVFASTQYPCAVRCQATGILRDCIELLFMVKEEYPHAAQTFLVPILPMWLDTFRDTFLGCMQAGVTADSFSLRFEVVKTLNKVMEQFPKLISSHLASYMEPVWNTLQTLLPIYVQAAIKGEDLDGFASEGTDPESLFTHGIYALFDFLSLMAGRKSTKGAFLVPSFLSQLVELVLHYMQMSEDQEEAWQNDPNQFISDEDVDTYSFSPRHSADDLVQTLLDRFPKETLQALLDATSNIFRGTSKSESDSHWWKPAEASLFALGRASDSILGGLEDGSLKFDLAGLFEHIVNNLVGCVDVPFVRGRAIWFASKFSKALPAPLARQYCEAAANALKNHQEPTPVRISAIQAVQSFCQELDSSFLIQYQASILQGMCDLLLITSGDALMMLLETFTAVLSVDVQVAAAQQQLFMPLLLKVWSRNPSDQVMNSVIVEILERLASVPEMFIVLLTHCGPVMVTSLAGYRADNEDACASAANALDLMAILIKKAISPPPNELVQLLAPTLSLLADPHLDDASIMQNGQLMIKSLVERFLSSLPTLSVSVAGQTTDGLGAVLTIFSRLLDPQRTTESATIFLGDLLLKYLMHGMGLPAVEASIPTILAGCIARLAQDRTPTSIQSMVMVFAWLMERQLDAVLDFLDKINIQGSSGVQILMRCWCEHAQDFHGYYAIRLCTSALCKLVMSGDARVAAVIVKGDRLMDTTASKRIVTRSRSTAAPERWSEVSAMVKAIKLLLQEWSHQKDNDASYAKGEHAFASADMSFDDGDDDDDDEEEGGDWEDEEAEEGAMDSRNAFLAGLVERQEEMAEDDLEFQKEPAYQIQFRPYLHQFFTAWTQKYEQQVPLFLQALSAEERHVLEQALLL